MAKKEPDLLVGIDLGTTEVRCLIGTRPTEEDRNFRILSVGYAPNEGMRNGIIVNLDEVIGAIDAAVEQAEMNAGHSITSATININGAHLQSMIRRDQVAVSSSQRIVSEFDRDLLHRKAKEDIHLPPNREVVQFFPNIYRVDQVKNLENPIGISGNVVGVQALVVTGITNYIEMLENACTRANIGINNIVFSSLAAYEATFDRQAAESGVAVIDIGHSTTNIVLVKEGKIEHIEVIPLGGFNVTKDISIILQVDLEVAEFLKVNYTDLQYEGRGTKTVEFNRQSINFSPQNLSEVVTDRLKEICELVEQILKEKGFMRSLPGGIILTGGAAQTKGLCDLFQHQLKTYTRLGSLRNFGGLVETIEHKYEYVTVAGIMALDYILQVKKMPTSNLRSSWKWSLNFFNLFKGRLKDRKRVLKHKFEQSRQSNSSDDKNQNE